MLLMPIPRLRRFTRHAILRRYLHGLYGAGFGPEQVNAIVSLDCQEQADVRDPFGAWGLRVSFRNLCAAFSSWAMRHTPVIISDTPPPNPSIAQLWNMDPDC